MTTEEKVLLLALMKKEEGETLQDTLLVLENSRVFTLKEGKKVAKSLKKDGYIKESQLTFKGMEAAKAAEQEFKL
ncbi:MAG: hypothetical protein L3J42_02335 [Hydrogenimonas sp.]|nr:hypothetical protein [Hydrogenimonas sp.]